MGTLLLCEELTYLLLQDMLNLALQSKWNVLIVRINLTVRQNTTQSN